MLEILFLIASLLIAFAAWEDWKDREYETAAFIFIMILSIVIFFTSYKTYLSGDVYAMSLFMGITFVLLILKKVSIGDLGVLPLLLLAPFNFVIALLISSLVIIPITQYGYKLFGAIKPIIQPPIPFVTIMFVMFFLVSAQMWFNTGDWFWHVCLDLTQNTETMKCTFIGLEYQQHDVNNPNEPKYELNLPNQ